MFHHAPYQFGSFALGGLKVPIDIGFIVLAVLLPIYTLVDFITGIASAVFFGGCFLLSTHLHQSATFGQDHFRYALILHIVAWIA